MTAKHTFHIRRRVIIHRTLRNHSNREIILALKALGIEATDRTICRDRCQLRKEGLLPPDKR